MPVHEFIFEEGCAVVGVLPFAVFEGSPNQVALSSGRQYILHLAEQVTGIRAARFQGDSHRFPLTNGGGPGVVMSALDGVGSRIPEHRFLTKVRLVRHVAGEGSVVAEDGVLHHRLA